MNHAEKISADGKTTNVRKPVTTSSPIERIWKVDATTKRCKRTKEGQTSGCATHDVTNAFLGMRFYSRLQEPEIVERDDRRKFEREFYKSLSLISKKLQITMEDCKTIPFPYNISESLANLRTQLKVSMGDWKEVRLVNDGNSTYFAKEDRYDTGMTLYYIPVIPLYTILHNKKTAKASRLLIAVYAYIYQTLGVPYYRNEDSYLNAMYEMLENSYFEDEEEEEQEGDQYVTQFTDAELIGDFIKEMIADPKNLQSFQKLINDFKPKNDFEKEVRLIALSFYELYSSYPNERIDRKFSPLRYRELPDDFEQAVILDNYVSFCASIKGNLFETLCNFVNDELQEFSEIDQPTRFIPFDNRKMENNDFDFEAKVFDSIDNLIRLWQEHNI